MRGFTLLELIVTLAVMAVVAVLALRWGDGLRRSLAMEEGVSTVVSSLLSAQLCASSEGAADLSADPLSGSLAVGGANRTVVALPRGVRFGYAPPPRTTGGDPVAADDDGIHLDGRGNRRAFLGDGLPEGSLSLAVYLVESVAPPSGRPLSRAVTMTALTGRIRVWRRSQTGPDRWLSDG